jgi:hypothetical protein
MHLIYSKKVFIYENVFIPILIKTVVEDLQVLCLISYYLIYYQLLFGILNLLRLICALGYQITLTNLPKTRLNQIKLSIQGQFLKLIVKIPKVKNWYLKNYKMFCKF